MQGFVGFSTSLMLCRFDVSRSAVFNQTKGGQGAFTLCNPHTVPFREMSKVRSGELKRNQTKFLETHSSWSEGKKKDSQPSIITPNTVSHLPETFKEIGLSGELIDALSKSNKEIGQPTQIQSLVIPEILKRHHPVVFASQTGTGKTLAYLLPIIQHLKEDELLHKIEARPKRPRAIVLVPNRELCEQVLDVAKSLSHYAKFRSFGLSGGTKESPQKRALESKLDLLVATPGRLLKLKEKGQLFLTDVRHLVVDEADTMFDKDFETNLEEIFLPTKGRKKDLPLFHKPTQFIIASATLTGHVQQQLKKHFPDLVTVTAPRLHMSLEKLKQNWVEVVGGGDKHDELTTALSKSDAKRTLIFCNTIPSCRSTEHFLKEQGFSTSCFHGDILPKQREENWEEFKNGKATILVCTDIASRGLDTTMVEHVILFDFPLNTIDYLHRIGRTARAGKSGEVTNLITKRDKVLANAIQDDSMNGRTE